MSISSPPHTLSPSNSLRRSSSASNSSPEFEFWSGGGGGGGGGGSLLRNPSLHLLSADQLFSGGFLLPLHLLDIEQNTNESVSQNHHHHHHHHPLTPSVLESADDDGNDKSEVGEKQPSSEKEADRELDGTDVLVVPTVAVSKRWKDIIFKKKVMNDIDSEKVERNINQIRMIKKERSSKRKESRNGNNSGSNSNELININLWPFSRSSSAGYNVGRTTTTTTTMNRKVSSAPCSRSNSAGESKSSSSKKLPVTTKGGFHIGKNPVWLVRKVGSSGRINGSSPNTTPIVSTSSSTDSTITTDDNDNNNDVVVEKDVEKSIDVKRDSGEESRRFSKPKSEATGGGGGILGGGVLGGGGMKGLVMNLSVPMCMGYRSHSTCRNEDISPVVAGNGGDEAAESGGAADSGGGESGAGGGGGGNMLNLRSLFTKRVH